MNLSATLPTAAGSTSSTNSAAPSDQGHESALASDFETFLKMLTVQMQNQDPLNPMDSSEFAMQLATFSSVEQQVLTNDLLGEMGARMSMANISQLSAWVGMDVKAVMPAVYDGRGIDVAVSRMATADSADLVVRDRAGTEVARFAVTEGMTEMTWNGVDGNGNPVLYGTYRFEVENRAAGEIIETRGAPVYARVEEAVVGAHGPVLRTGTGVSVAAEDVLSLRAPR